MTPGADPGRPLTILQVVPALDAGGAEQTCVEIAGALDRAGHRAIAAGAPGRLVADFEAAGGIFRPLPLNPKNPLMVWRNAGRLARLIEAESVDIVHARSRAPAWSALLAARRTGRAFVTTYHGIYSERSALKRAYNSVMARGDVVIANSAFTADLVHTRYGTPREHIRIIHRGIEPTAFDPQSVAAERLAGLRGAWNVSDQDTIVLLAGRLTAWKGQEVAIRAAAALAAGGHPRVILVLAGAGQGRDAYRAGLEALIDELGLGSTVRIVGHIADMPAAYCLADVAISASTRPEAFGRSIVEAQAMARPVIATDLGATRETVLAPPAVAPAERTGWLIKPGDPAALGASIAQALALTANERAGLAARSRGHVLAHFTVAGMTDATLSIYADLAGGKVSPKGALPD